MSGFVYLASPYTHQDPEVRAQRFDRVCREAGRMMAAGEAVFCPIAHSHPIELALPGIEGFDFWMRQDVPILRHASRMVVLMLDGWSESKGVAHEIDVAERLYIPLTFVVDDERLPLDQRVRIYAE